LLSLRAIDPTASQFIDDSLQTSFDLTSFANVQFEFLEIVPIASLDPLPIVYQHWIGVVSSIIAVPEPGAASLAALAIFSVVLQSFRRP
jgi:hypothetical protein